MENLTEQICGSAHHISEPWKQDGMGKYPHKTVDSLAERLRHGSQVAAVELVELYYKQIYGYMRRLGHSRHISEDLTQECFLHAWHHLWQLRDTKALNGWIYHIASNVSRYYWRRNKIRKTVGLEDFDSQGSDSLGVDIAENLEKLNRLQKAIVELPVKLKQAVVLHYMQQLTIAEAALAAGVKEGTLKSRLNRALETLRKQFI